MTKITAPLLMFSVLLVSSPPGPGTRVISQVHDDPPLTVAAVCPDPRNTAAR